MTPWEKQMGAQGVWKYWAFAQKHLQNFDNSLRASREKTKRMLVTEHTKLRGKMATTSQRKKKQEEI